MAVMPPNSTASPEPVPTPLKIQQYRRPVFPAKGEPVRPHLGSRLTAQAAYVPNDMPIDDLQDGFSPTLQVGPTTVPDDIRVGARKPPLHSPDPQWYIRRGRDELARKSVERTVSTGWRIVQTRDAVPMSVPESRDYPATRGTAIMGPNTYLFTRPWPTPPAFTGEHFTLADHRRMNEIMGQKPQGRTGVNTYRRDPEPWDSGLYPMPPVESPGTAYAATRLSGNRSYRAAGRVMP